VTRPRSRERMQARGERGTRGRKPPRAHTASRFPAG
jgi:hypothetical protein